MERVKISVTGGIAAGAGAAVSERVLAVSGMFGIDAGEKRETQDSKRKRSEAETQSSALSPGHFLWRGAVELEIGGGDVVLISGPSGGGKSTLLRRIEAALKKSEGTRVKDEGGNANDETRNAKQGVDAPLETGNRKLDTSCSALSTQSSALSVVRLSEIAVETDRAVVDCFACSLEETLAILSRVGLAEARLWVRRPSELSEGQQFRYRLAKFMASDSDILIADEFCAVLDRVTAKIVAWNLGKFVRGSVGTERPRAAVVATSHEDLCEDLRPNVLVWKGLGSEVRVTRGRGECVTR